MSTISLFRTIENKRDVYRSKDCMRKFCEFIREYPIKTINFKKKKMKLLIKEQQESFENSKICYICKEKFEDLIDIWTIKNIVKIDHCNYTGEYRGAAQNIRNLKCSVPKNFL